MGLALLDCGGETGEGAGAKLAGAGFPATMGRPNWGLLGCCGLTIGCLCWAPAVCCGDVREGTGGGWTNCLGGVCCAVGRLLPPINAGRKSSSVGRGTGGDGLNAGLVCSRCCTGAKSCPRDAGGMFE